jgi:hypothetical protein
MRKANPVSMQIAASALAVALFAATSIAVAPPAGAGSKVHGSSEACLKLLAHSGADATISPKSGKRHVRVGNQAAYNAAVQECMRRRGQDVGHVMDKAKKHSEQRFRENKQFAEEILGLKGGKNHGGRKINKGHGKKFQPGLF